MTIETQLTVLQNQNAQLTQIVNALVERVTGQADAIDARVNAAVLAVPDMHRQLYVDSASGSDTNDGSESTPFASLNRAVDALPSFGGGTITIKGDHTLATDVHLKGKHVRMRGDGSNTLTLAHVETEFNNIAGFRLFDFPSSVQFQALKVVVEQTRNDAKTNSTNYNAVSVYGGASGSNVFVASTNITHGDVPFLSVENGLASLYARDTSASGSASFANTSTGALTASFSNCSKTGGAWFSDTSRVLGGA